MLDLHPYAPVPSSFFVCACFDGLFVLSLNQVQEKDLLDAIVKLCEVLYDGKSLCQILLIQS